MNNRLNQKFAELRKENRKALSIFVTAGYPSIDATPGIVKTLEDSGADIVELGIPFSDPLADGPTIQRSSYLAIKNGINPDRIFDTVDRIRKDSQIPIVLMGYINSIMNYGMDRFIETAAGRGVDGIIVPDLPLEESGEYIRFSKRHNISTIFLAAPTTPDERLGEIDDASDGFVYCVSLTGVTGRSNGLPDNIKEYLQRCRKYITKNPILVGFGITSADDAYSLAQFSDGVIIGSALIKRINEYDNYLPSIRNYISDIRNALDRKNN